MDNDEKIVDAADVLLYDDTDSTLNQEYDFDDDGHIKMDYSLETPEERVKKVEEIIAATPSEKLNSFYLNKMAEYILDGRSKTEKKEKEIITNNHMITVNKREMSFEGLVGKLENGEDGIYNMIANDKNIIFQPKITITDEEIEAIPELKQLVTEIKKVEEQIKHVRGKKAFALRKQLIEMRQDQYVIKSAYVKPRRANSIIKSLAKMDLTDDIYFDDNNFPHNRSFIDFFNKDHISLLLCNYSKLKEESWDKFGNDIKWTMFDLDTIVDKALKDKYPLYYDIVRLKIDGKQNVDIQTILQEKYGTTHSIEYLSSLWRNKIPRLISETATEDYLIWYYTFKEKGKWKKCTRCGQIKLAHNQFFSRNKTSKDGFYSICKCCRNKKE